MKYCPTCRATYPEDFSVCPRDQARLQITDEFAPGMVLRDKYEILERLGAGGMATVYRARHLVFDEICAIKVVGTQFARDADFVQRFRNEAIITRKLRHPNAVRLDDFDTTEDGRPFLVMAHVEGKSLRSLIGHEAPLPCLRAVRITRQVLAALGAAHAIGIVHRDIKPDNILVQPMPVRSEYGTDIVKVLDFGIAMMRATAAIRAGGYAPTQAGMVVGTPQYISPEQAMGKSHEEVDGRSDLYSLGVVLYEMLSARLPFEDDNPLALMVAHMQAPPPLLEKKRPDLHFPPALSAVVLKALEKDPDKRFQNAEEMLAALQMPELTQQTAVLGSGVMEQGVAVAAAAVEHAASAGAVPEFRVMRPEQTNSPLSDDLDLMRMASAAMPTPAKPVPPPTPVLERTIAVPGAAGAAKREPMVSTPAPPPPPPPTPAPAAVAPVSAKPKVQQQMEAGPELYPSAKGIPPRPTPARPVKPAESAMPAAQAKPRPAPRASRAQETVFSGAAARSSVDRQPWLRRGMYAVVAIVIVAIAAALWTRHRAIQQTPSLPPTASVPTVQPIDDDARIKADVEQALTGSQALQNSDIQVVVRAGVVTLTGKTRDSDVPDTARTLANSVIGVKQVISRITVLSSDSSTPDEAAPSPSVPPGPQHAPLAGGQPFGANPAPEQIPGALPSTATPGVQQLRVDQLVSMGQYKLQQGQYRAAARAFRLALRLDPNNAAAQHGLRQAMQQGR